MRARNDEDASPEKKAYAKLEGMVGYRVTGGKHRRHEKYIEQDASPPIHQVRIQHQDQNQADEQEQTAFILLGPGCCSRSMGKRCAWFHDRFHFAISLRNQFSLQISGESL